MTLRHGNDLFLKRSEKLLHPLFPRQVHKDVHVVVLQQAKGGAQVVTLLHRAVVVDQRVL